MGRGNKWRRRRECPACLDRSCIQAVGVGRVPDVFIAAVYYFLCCHACISNRVTMLAKFLSKCGRLLSRQVFIENCCFLINHLINVICGPELQLELHLFYRQ